MVKPLDALPKQSPAQLRMLAQEVNAFLRKERPTFALNQPTQISVKGRLPATSTYRLSPFIGEEQFVLNGAFLDHGKVWISMTPVAASSEFAFARVEFSRAKELFDDFGYLFERWAQGLDDRSIAESAEHIEDLERQARYDAMLEDAGNNPNFATW